MISKIFSSIQSKVKIPVYKTIQKQFVKPQQSVQSPIAEHIISQYVDKNSQLILGDFVLDLKNPEIEKKLKQNEEVKIGASKECNIVIPSFHSGIYPTHVVLRQDKKKNMIVNSKPFTNVQIINKNSVNPFYFGTRNLNFAQENIGDCYLLSTLYSLSRTSFGENFLKNIVSINEDGNYVVKFLNKDPIIVEKDELYGDKEKKSVTGELGLKAIERAYAKLINPLYAQKVPYASKMNIPFLDKGGFMTTALLNLTGLKTDEYDVKQTDLNFLLKNIKEYGLNHQIITCSTPPTGEYGKFMDKEEKFRTAHAYSVKEIDTENKTIEIVNPHNTKKSETISWDSFKKMFEFLCVARLKKDTQN